MSMWLVFLVVWLHARVCAFAWACVCAYVWMYANNDAACHMLVLVELRRRPLECRLHPRVLDHGIQLVMVRFAVGEASC